MQILKTLSLTLLFVAMGAVPALAQQSSGADADHTLSAEALDAAVAGHESAVDQQRAQLADLLSREEVRDVARDRGIDMGRVESAAAGLSDAQVGVVAPLVAAAAPQSDGGLGTVSISVVALILILLIVIVVS